MLDNTGLIVTDALINITDPVTNQTWAFLTTDGNIYVFNGAGYDVITGGGAGSGITTLTGDVTAGPGSGSQAATIAAAAVTLAKIANAAANSKLVGSGASGSGSAYSEITLGTNLSMSGTTLNAATGGGGGDLTLIESHTFTANATSFTFSGLDGDTDGQYLLLGRILLNGSSNTVSVRPNASSSSLIEQRLYNGGTDSQAEWKISTAATTGATFDFNMTIFASKSINSVARERAMTMHLTQYLGGGVGNLFTISATGIWAETATNITSLQIISDQANGIANGSYAALYKYTQ